MCIWKYLSHPRYPGVSQAERLYIKFLSAGICHVGGCVQLGAKNTRLYFNHV